MGIEDDDVQDVGEEDRRSWRQMKMWMRKWRSKKTRWWKRKDRRRKVDEELCGRLEKVEEMDEVEDYDAEEVGKDKVAAYSTCKW